jgi:glycosyltransferase involved in cell wall biosynthesis
LRGLHGDWNERAANLRRFLNEVDLIVTASDHLRRRLIEFGAPAERVVSSAYGLDSSWAAGHTTKTPGPALRFGFVGQVIPMKGVHILLRAVAAVDRNIDFQLMVYGNLDKDQEYGARLRAIAGEDPRIQFCGTFPNEDMGRILTSIDMLVVPSLWYDFPLVIPSAFATRTPVIATDLPGMNEMVVDGSTGFLFERGDWRQLAALLQRLAASPETARALGAQIPDVKSDRQMAAEYARYYSSIIGSAGSPKELCNATGRAAIQSAGD